MTPTGSETAFLCCLALVALLRLGEVLVSALRARARPQALVAEPWLFPLMVLLHVALLTAPAAEVLLLERPFLPWLTGAASSLLALALALRVWTLWSLGRAWNVRVVVPEAQAVVTRGPYALIRHPNYLVVVLEVATLPLLHTAWLSALCLSLLNALVLARRIRTEEAALARVPAWREAMATKKRLLPGVF